MQIKVEVQEVTSKDRTTLNDIFLVVDEMEVKASVKSFTIWPTYYVRDYQTSHHSYKTMYAFVWFVERLKIVCKLRIVNRDYISMTNKTSSTNRLYAKLFNEAYFSVFARTSSIDNSSLFQIKRSLELPDVESVVAKNWVCPKGVAWTVFIAPGSVIPGNNTPRVCGALVGVWLDP